MQRVAEPAQALQEASQATQESELLKNLSRQALQTPVSQAAQLALQHEPATGVCSGSLQVRQFVAVVVQLPHLVWSQSLHSAAPPLFKSKCVDGHEVAQVYWSTTSLLAHLMQWPADDEQAWQEALQTWHLLVPSRK